MPWPRRPVALAGLLLESLDQAPSPGVEAAWAEEIERRVRELDSGEVKPVAWEDVKNRLLAREVSGYEA